MNTVEYFSSFLYNKMFSRYWFKVANGKKDAALAIGFKGNLLNTWHNWKPTLVAQIEQAQRVAAKSSVMRLYEAQASLTLDINIKQKLARKLMLYNTPTNKNAKPKSWSTLALNYLNDTKAKVEPEIALVPKLNWAQKASLLRTPITVGVLAIVVGAIVIVVEVLRFIVGPIYYPLVKKSSFTDYLKFGVLLPIYRVAKKTLYAPIDIIYAIPLSLIALNTALNINTQYNKIVQVYLDEYEAERTKLITEELEKIRAVLNLKDQYTQEAMAKKAENKIAVTEKHDEFLPAFKRSSSTFSVSLDAVECVSSSRTTDCSTRTSHSSRSTNSLARV